MLNRGILMGRITQDLELKQTTGGTSVLSFSVAVDRNFVKQGEERQTDFINCVAWRQQAEFISKYSAPRQASQPAYNEPSQKPIAIGDLDDFEEILGDDGVPF